MSKEKINLPNPLQIWCCGGYSFLTLKGAEKHQSLMKQHKEAILHFKQASHYGEESFELTDLRAENEQLKEDIKNIQNENLKKVVTHVFDIGVENTRLKQEIEDLKEKMKERVEE